MNVLVRNTRGEKGTRRRAGSFRDRHSAAPAASTADSPAETATHGAEPAPRDDATPARRRQHGPVEDNALYSCHCGFVFEAAVSTTVACPHCGDGQAW